MRTGLRRVARGLTLVNTGLSVAHLALAWLVVMPCVSSVLPLPQWVRATLMFAPPGLLVAGGLACGLVGRGLCLNVPAEAAAARARIVLAVVLEVCGLLSAAAWTADRFGHWLPDAAGWVGGGFAAVCVVAARVMFLLFCRSLAGYVEVPKGEDRTRPLLFVSAGLAAGLVAGAGVVAVLVKLKAVYKLDEWVVPVAVGLYGLCLLFAFFTWVPRYTEMLTALSARVDLFAEQHAPPDDEEAEGEPPG